MERIFSKLLEAFKIGHDTLLVTIVSDRGSAPRGAGSQMLVGPEGRMVGTIGGGAVEANSERIALEQLRRKESRCQEFQLHTNARDNIGMVCGGDVRVHFQYIPADSRIWNAVAELAMDRIAARNPGWLALKLDGSAPSLLDESGKPLLGSAVAGTVTHKVWLPDRSEDLFCLPLPIGERAILFGGGHCAQALAPLLSTVGFRVTVMDSRPEYANRERFPQAEHLVVGDFTKLSDYMTLGAEDYAVVMTNGHAFDLEVEDQLLRQDLAYVGVIGSKSKKAAVNAKLMERGISEAALATVHSPIGISIKAVTPEEIAVSIAAEMIQVRALRREAKGHTAKGCPMREG